MSNKKRNKAIRAKYELQKQMVENPDWCWCDKKLGLPADVDYDKDEPIGMTEPIDGFPRWNSKGYTVPIYKCKRCGKKHDLQIAFA